MSTDNPISFTELAVKKIEEAFGTDKYTDDYFLRIGVRGGGCSGLTYVLEFQNEPRDIDLELSAGSVKVRVDQMSLIYLQGTTVEYKETLSQSGFAFTNPNQKSKCGCDKSFSA